MSIYFSEKFKTLRKKSDLTQEQIADIFHVAPQSVSRWETGANYPDIELLPHIAIFFKVTLDELLGTEKILSEKKIEEYIRDIRNLLNSGKLYEAIELARKAAKEYPVNGGGLSYHLLVALCKACSEETPGFKENTEKYKSEIIAVGERIINNDPNNWGIKAQLVRQYAKWGMREEAKKILDTMPGEIWDSKEVWSGCILDGEEWQRNQKVRIVRIAALLCHFISEYSYSPKICLTPLQKIECLKAEMQIGSIIAPLTADVASSFHDNPDSADYVESAFRNIRFADLYCEAGDTASALDYVEKATQDSMHHIEIMDRTNADGSNYMPWSTPRNLCWILWEEHLAYPLYDCIRDDERFIRCFDLLKLSSRELT